MESIISDIKKYRKKIQTNRNNVFSVLDSVKAELQDTSKHLQSFTKNEENEHECTIKAILRVKKLNKKITKKICKSVIEENKLIYDSISKIGKGINKCFHCADALDSDFIEFQKNPKKQEEVSVMKGGAEIDTIIAEHLFRSGRFEAGEKFCNESKVILGEEFKKRFKALDQILTDLNHK